jgi:hypothetical protein
MTNLAAVADAYDAWVKQRYVEIDEMYYFANTEVARRHGANSLQSKFFLGLSTTVYGLYMASQMVGQGFVDLLRVGETLKNPTAGNIAQDGLRLVSLAAPVFKVARLAGAAGVSGGNYASSCGATATTFAARLSATKLVMRLKDFQSALKLPMSPTDPAFAGVTMAEIAEALDAIGAKTIHRVMKGWADVEAMLDLAKGPVVFVIEFMDQGTLTRHAMAAFRVAGETTIADQAGLASGKSVQSLYAQLNAKYIAGWVVEDSALVHAVNLASGTAVAVNMPVGLDRVRSNDLTWLAETLLLPAWLIPAKVLVGLGDLVNEKLGRPRLTGNGGLSADANNVLRATPAGAGASSLIVQVGSGLSADAFLAAVAELESKGRLRVVRAPGAPLGIVSLVRLQ